MTMPVELARRLRWGWDLLWELQSAVNLTPELPGSDGRCTILYEQCNVCGQNQ
jgi:hypothetical protein